MIVMCLYECRYKFKPTTSSIPSTIVPVDRLMAHIHLLYLAEVPPQLRVNDPLSHLYLIDTSDQRL
jgi:hypothetical protein